VTTDGIIIIATLVIMVINMALALLIYLLAEFPVKEIVLPD
jgi:hypothetical protein